MGRLLKLASRGVVAADIDGLRPSRLRLMAEVPPGGCRITELAERAGMTKQACGQIVSDLVTSGHLTVATPEEDRRSRLIRTTPKGRRAVAASLRALSRIDTRWSDQVGEERFATFLEVLGQLTRPDPD